MALLLETRSFGAVGKRRAWRVHQDTNKGLGLWTEKGPALTLHIRRALRHMPGGGQKEQSMRQRDQKLSVRKLEVESKEGWVPPPSRERGTDERAFGERERCIVFNM